MLTSARRARQPLVPSGSFAVMRPSFMRGLGRGDLSAVQAVPVAIIASGAKTWHCNQQIARRATAIQGATRDD
jgi:hypothetical protein